MKKAKRLSLAAVMALALMTALWAPAALASEPQFEASSYPATVKGDVTESHTLTFNNGGIEVTCNDVDFSNDVLTAPRDFLIPEADYSDCAGIRAGRQTLQAEVDMNSCVHVLNVDHEGLNGIYWGGWDTWCYPDDAMQVKVWSTSQNPAVDSPQCVFDITPGQFDDGDAYDDLLWSSYSDVVHFLVDDLAYVRSGGSVLLCGSASATNGTYDGKSFMYASTGGFTITD
ncbi:MAG TPA: hypothetical protein VNM89_01800 [Solirubrobacterales bacterium]|nr:hypothetical protein [Solirubrobacterales bacterium]